MEGYSMFLFLCIPHNAPWLESEAFPLAKLLKHLRMCWSWGARWLDTLSSTIDHCCTVVTLIMMGPEIWGFFLNIVRKSTRRVCVPVHARVQEGFRDFFHLAIPSMYWVDMANGLLSPSIEDWHPSKALKTFTFEPCWTALVVVCPQWFCGRSHPTCPPLDDTWTILELWGWWHIQSLDCLHAQQKGFIFLTTLRLCLGADHVESLSALLRMHLFE